MSRRDTLIATYEQDFFPKDRLRMGQVRIDAKFPIPEYNAINFVGPSFLGRIRRIYYKGLVDEYIVTGNVSKDKQVCFEVATISSYSKKGYIEPIKYSILVLAYKNGQDTAIGIYRVGTFVKYNYEDGMSLYNSGDP